VRAVSFSPKALWRGGGDNTVTLHKTASLQAVVSLSSWVVEKLQ
jgi:hypothetical protein